jgi:hypothetical protein
MNELATLSQPTETAAKDREPVLKVINGSKVYGGVHAIEGVGFDLYPGEVHALVGENGAGKSTLCKAIAGAIRLTSGEMYLDGKPVDFEQPRDALAAGICMVYQETSLVPTMTAAQNIELGNEKLLTRRRSCATLSTRPGPAARSPRWWSPPSFSWASRLRSSCWRSPQPTPAKMSPGRPRICSGLTLPRTACTWICLSTNRALPGS